MARPRYKVMRGRELVAIVPKAYFEQFLAERGVAVDCLLPAVRETYLRYYIGHPNDHGFRFVEVDS